MDLSILPDDIIKEIESYVDKSPPFSEELLNREFSEYYDTTYQITKYYGYRKGVLFHSCMPDTMSSGKLFSLRVYEKKYWGSSNYRWSNLIY